MPRLPHLVGAAAVLAALSAPLCARAQTAWWDTDYAWRQLLPLDGSELSANQSNVPLLVLLDSSRIDYGELTNNGRDLRFVTAAGVELVHEVEIWDTTGTSVVWVLLPELRTGSRWHPSGCLRRAATGSRGSDRHRPGAHGGGRGSWPAFRGQPQGLDLGRGRDRSSRL